MIELESDRLNISFPDIHPEAYCSIEFQRTLRIPDDNREHPLPPGLGRFPLRHVDDYAAKLPPVWREHGGIFLPMYQAEALWIRFSGHYPFAIKIAAGKINAVTGAPWDNSLHAAPQDYVVIPGQPWLDGFCVAKDIIRQFVAMPLGQGFTAEEQLTGIAEHGGIQIIAYPMKRDAFVAIQEKKRSHYAPSCCMQMMAPKFESAVEMGLAPGGLVRQQIFEDEHGLDVWDTSDSSRCFVHILNSSLYQFVTGKVPPTKSPTAQDYTKAGLPWFDYYDENSASLTASRPLISLDSVAATMIKRGKGTMAGNEPADPKKVVRLKGGSKEIRQGKF